MKTAIVTGSSRGIGRGIADLLDQNGYTVIYSGTKPERPADLPDEKSYFAADISDGTQRRALVAFALEKYGRLDVLVNNAGIAPRIRRDILEMDEDSFDEVLGVNLRGTTFMCQLAAKAMLEGKKTLSDYAPRIINIGSMSAYTASVNRGEYCISKAGVGMVTKLFAERLAAEGREDLSFVWEAVKTLPEQYRAAIHLYYYEGYPTAEIARILQRKESSVRSDLRRGREKLKGILKEAYDFAEQL